jgi:hypothetical protein
MLQALKQRQKSAQPAPNKSKHKLDIIPPDVAVNIVKFIRDWVGDDEENFEKKEKSRK